MGSKWPKLNKYLETTATRGPQEDLFSDDVKVVVFEDKKYFKMAEKKKKENSILLDND